MTPRELVKKTLEFQNPRRVPRQLWSLPWANLFHEAGLNKIKTAFPDDIVSMPLGDFINSEGFCKLADPQKRDPYGVGFYTDCWGCTFQNYQRGAVGEVKEPLIKDEDWLDDEIVQLPEQAIQIDKATVNAFCASTDKFVIMSDHARPFERLQFLRGTEQLYMDLVLKPERMYRTFEKVHDFYCRLLTAWAQTDVDALSFMDDWGSQRSLLISPDTWVAFFKPMYKDYIAIARKYGKKIFMHSDGYIVDILPHLIELGLDAINSQIFCMGLDALEPFRGKITFWGEIDRQHLLPYGSQADIDIAVKGAKRALWANGGCIAQCEFGPGANPDNVYQVFKTWDEI